jgi:ribosome-binding factor A
MKSQRQLQIGETIKRVISDIFLRDDIFFNKHGTHITVSQADASPDAKNVKIFVNKVRSILMIRLI